MTQKEYKKLEDYGIIGNLDTCALVGKDGSIDWCCFPHIESPSVFAALLDVENGGHFKVQPAESFESMQQYIPKTNVLQTTFKTSTGNATLTDFMPPLKREYEAITQAHQTIFRRVSCDKGWVTLAIDFAPRFDYARVKTIVKNMKTGVMAQGNGEQLFLNVPVPLTTKGDSATGSHRMKKGDTIWTILQYGHYIPLTPLSCEQVLQASIEYWKDWAHNCEGGACVFGGTWHDVIERSGLVLKLLTHRETGAIAAAPTTSLPEEVGGIRNWDYRFNWVRDAAFTVQALYQLGHIKEARDHLGWYTSICEHTKPEKIQIMYGLHGETDLKEQELWHLSGYRNSRPVRIGNGAATQRQLDIYGELINALYETTRYGEEVTQEEWPFFKRIIDYVCEVWDTPDAGIWEVRGKLQHFVYSKLMCWVALNRGIKLAQKEHLKAPFDDWLRHEKIIRKAILQKGFNKSLNSFVQSFSSQALDATSLLIPLMGFLPFDDPRVQGTIDATMKHLTSNGFVYRYKGEDGLPGKEGAFALCTFWLVDNLSLSGRVKEAKEVFSNLLAKVSPLGLLAEEIDPQSGEQLGNFPQAFSHIGFINSALYLAVAEGKEQKGPELAGMEEDEKVESRSFEYSRFYVLDSKF